MSCARALASLVIVALTWPVEATTFLAVVTEREAVVGVDSKATRDDGEGVPRCKLIVGADYVATLRGRGEEGSIDLRVIIREALDAEGPIRERVVRLQGRLAAVSKDLGEAPTDVVVAAWLDGRPQIAELSVAPLHEIAGPAAVADAPRWHRPGRRGRYLVSATPAGRAAARASAWGSIAVAERVRAILTEEIARDPATKGQPVQIARVTKGGARWIDRAGPCALDGDAQHRLGQPVVPGKQVEEGEEERDHHPPAPQGPLGRSIGAVCGLWKARDSVPWCPLERSSRGAYAPGMAGKATHGGAREGAGRKAKVESPVRVTVDLQGPLAARIDAWAGRHAISRSEAIRRLLGKIRLPP